MSGYCRHRRRDDRLSSDQCHSTMFCVGTHGIECRQKDRNLNESISIVPCAPSGFSNSHTARS